jgi:hypothetical protein
MSFQAMIAVAAVALWIEALRSRPRPAVAARRIFKS